MPRSNRWNGFLLMFIIIADTSGLPQITANTSTYEVSVETCSIDEFHCQNGSGNCIRESWRCDGEDDCTDGSDEKDCFNDHLSGSEPCKFGGFMCEDGSNRCIRKSWRCDGEDDCIDGSDEKNCYSHKVSVARCWSGEFMCLDGSERCIRRNWRCDGEYDCKDGSDEKNCFTTSMKCPPGEFMCKDSSKKCIRGSWRCDGDDDCSDGSDEKNCYITDSIEQGLNISNDHQLDYIFRDNEYASQTFEELINIIENLTEHQEDNKLRSLIGCSLDRKLKLAKCLFSCKDFSCKLLELRNYLAACISSTVQYCTTTKYTNCPRCGEGNPNRARRIGETTIKLTKEPIRVIGGTAVSPPRRYPWVVALMRPAGPRGLTIHGGGSIINDRWILTAAHNIVDTTTTICSPLPILSALIVRVGDHDIFSTADDHPLFTNDHTIKRFVKHPNVECGVPNSNNDFALLELTNKITFNSVIKPVCLPKNDLQDYAGYIAKVTGWGRDSLTTPSTSATLLEISVTIVAQTGCLMGPIFDAFEDTKLCAGPAAGMSTCLGDSGGALVVKVGNKYVQVGVVSYHKPGDCTDTTVSAIYGRVSKQLGWIKETTAKGKC